jgi:hypothetical protein
MYIKVRGWPWCVCVGLVVMCFFHFDEIRQNVQFALSVCRVLRGRAWCVQDGWSRRRRRRSIDTRGSRHTRCFAAVVTLSPPMHKCVRDNIECVICPTYPLREGRLGVEASGAVRQLESPPPPPLSGSPPPSAGHTAEIIGSRWRRVRAGLAWVSDAHHMAACSLSHTRNSLAPSPPVSTSRSARSVSFSTALSRMPTARWLTTSTRSSTPSPGSMALVSPPARLPTPSPPPTTQEGNLFQISISKRRMKSFVEWLVVGWEAHRSTPALAPLTHPALAVLDPQASRTSWMPSASCWASRTSRRFAQRTSRTLSTRMGRLVSPRFVTLGQACPAITPPAGPTRGTYPTPHGHTVRLTRTSCCQLLLTTRARGCGGLPRIFSVAVTRPTSPLALC